MKRGIALLLLLPLLSSCSSFKVHKMDIEQGNIITPAALKRIHSGMTEEQVINVLGTPLLTNIFTPGQLAYVYTIQPGHQAMTVKKATCWFKRGRLTTCDVEENTVD